MSYSLGFVSFSTQNGTVRVPFCVPFGGLLLFKSVLLHQFPLFAVGDVGLFRLVVDSDERDVGTFALYEHGVGDDSRAAALALGLRGDGEAHLAQVLPNGSPISGDLRRASRKSR